MLGYTDAQIWKLTPRQFSVQLSVHEDVTKKLHGGDSVGNTVVSSAANAVGYIDQIPGW